MYEKVAGRHLKRLPDQFLLVIYLNYFDKDKSFPLFLNSLTSKLEKFGVSQNH